MLEIHGSTVSRALKVEGGRRDHAPKGGNLSRTIETRNTGHEEPAHVDMEETRTGEETGPRRGQDAPTTASRPRGPVHEGALAPAQYAALCVGCRGGEVHKADCRAHLWARG